MTGDRSVFCQTKILVCDNIFVMQVVTPDMIQGKRVLLRLDLDVPLKNGVIEDDTRLLAGMDTLGIVVS